MRIGIRIPPCRPLTELIGAAQAAEEAGFDTVSVPDSPTLWRDTMTALAMFAEATDRVTLWTSVTNFVTRETVTLASQARTIAELAPGRFCLGVGAADSSALLTGRRAATTGAMRVGITTVRALLAGETVTMDGTPVTLQDPCGPVPICLAAEGPRNVALAAELADGVITTYRDITNKAARIAAAVAASGRTTPLRHIAVSFVGVSDDIGRDVQALKPRIAKSVQMEGPELFRAAGFDVQVPDGPLILSDGTDMGHPRDLDEAIRVAQQWISDDLAIWFARNVLLFGTADEIVDRILELAALGIDELQITDGGSYELPMALIASVGAEVIPRLRAREG